MEGAPDSWQQWLEIQDLYTRYFAALDDGPAEQWVNCFTEDGVLEDPFIGNSRGRTRGACGLDQRLSRVLGER